MRITAFSSPVYYPPPGFCIACSLVMDAGTSLSPFVRKVRRASHPHPRPIASHAFSTISLHRTQPESHSPSHPSARLRVRLPRQPPLVDEMRTLRGIKARKRGREEDMAAKASSPLQPNLLGTQIQTEPAPVSKPGPSSSHPVFSQPSPAFSNPSPSQPGPANTHAPGPSPAQPNRQHHPNPSSPTPAAGTSPC